MIRASNIHRDRNCSGAAAACEGVPEPVAQVWTGEGTIVHDLLKHPEKASEAEDHLVEIADQMQGCADWIVDKIFPEQEGYERLELIRDREEPFFVEYEGRKIISGHPDFIQIGVILGKRVALILDFKSGYLEVPAPEMNDQLRAYAVMVWQDESLAVEEVYVSIVPRFGKSPVPVHYTADELPLALLDLADVDAASRDKKAVRTPSVGACRYCRARATSKCPETLNIDPRLITMNSLIDLSPEKKGELLDLAEIATGNIKKLKERLKEEIASDPNAVEGWHMVPGDVRGSIPNVDACYQIVSDFMTMEEWQSCLKIAQKPLKDAIKDFLGATENIKGKAAAQRIKEILAPVTVLKQGEDRLEKKS